MPCVLVGEVFQGPVDQDQVVGLAGDQIDKALILEDVNCVEVLAQRLGLPLLEGLTAVDHQAAVQLPLPHQASAELVLLLPPDSRQGMLHELHLRFLALLVTSKVVVGIDAAGLFHRLPCLT